MNKHVYRLLLGGLKPVLKNAEYVHHLKQKDSGERLREKRSVESFKRTSIGQEVADTSVSKSLWGRSGID